MACFDVRYKGGLSPGRRDCHFAELHISYGMKLRVIKVVKITKVDFYRSPRLGSRLKKNFYIFYLH